MTHAATFTASTFDSSAWHATCRNILKTVGQCSGGIEHTYLSNIGFNVERAVADLPEDHRTAALAIAKNEYQYHTADEIKEWEKQSLAQGLCKHGLGMDHCPFGCGG